MTGLEIATEQTQATIEAWEQADDLKELFNDCLGYEKTTDEHNNIVRLTIQVSTYTWVTIGGDSKVTSYVDGYEYSEPLPDDVVDNFVADLENIL